MSKSLVVKVGAVIALAFVGMTSDVRAGEVMEEPCPDGWLESTGTGHCCMYAGHFCDVSEDRRHSIDVVHHYYTGECTDRHQNHFGCNECS